MTVQHTYSPGMSQPHLSPAGHHLPSAATRDQARSSHGSQHPSPSHSITTEDEEGIKLVLQYHDHVHHIRLLIPLPNLQKVIVALDNEFPILEWLYIQPPTKENASLILPKSFGAPHLCLLKLSNFAFQIGTPLLMTAIALITLLLDNISPSLYFHPNDLVHRLSQFPQLETLSIMFHSPVPNCEVKRELLRRPLTTHVTLPNLCCFGFGGATAYLEALLPCMTAPLLAKIEVLFFNQLTFHLPHVLQFLNTAENPRFSSTKLIFREEWFSAVLYPNKEARIYSLYMDVGCRYLDWQVASTAKIFRVLRSAFSSVEDLTLEYWRYDVSPERPNEADRTQWRDLLRPFSNDGESPVELLPELKELSYSYRRKFNDAFTAFIDARRIAGRPVTVVHHNSYF
ncbi:hypothetical protein BC827DRAFT_1158220 [Russula dissimulans]|nr:hypothetical protein BC827DRAFT_1158220 [Russula dissimulans]